MDPGKRQISLKEREKERSVVNLAGWDREEMVGGETKLQGTRWDGGRSDRIGASATT